MAIAVLFWAITVLPLYINLYQNIYRVAEPRPFFLQLIFQHTSKTGSWNELLLNNTTSNYYLNLSHLTTAEQNEFNKQRPIKFLGYGKEDDKLSDYYDNSLMQLFDVLIFLKETTQTTALFN